MGLFSFFNKPIKVKPEELSCRVLYAYPKRKTRKVKLNKELELTQDQMCCFCYGKKAYDTFTFPNTYQINANSLPNLFKNAGYNKPNKKGSLPTKYSFALYFTNTDEKFTNIKIKNFGFKDSFYGKVKTTFYFDITFNITNFSYFLTALLEANGTNITNKNIQKVLEKFFGKLIKKRLGKKLFSLSDAFHYTNMVNEDFTKDLQTKLGDYGMQINNVKIVDIVVKEDLERDIVFNKVLPFKMQKEIDKKNTFTVTKDGVPLNVQFDVPEHYSHNNLAQKYSLRGLGIIISKDQSEYKVTTLAGNVDEYGNPTDKKQVQVGKYCLYCHKLIPTDSSYCPYCRKEV